MSKPTLLMAVTLAVTAACSDSASPASPAAPVSVPMATLTAAPGPTSSLPLNPVPSSEGGRGDPMYTPLDFTVYRETNSLGAEFEYPRSWEVRESLGDRLGAVDFYREKSCLGSGTSGAVPRADCVFLRVSYDSDSTRDASAWVDLLLGLPVFDADLRRVRQAPPVSLERGPVTMGGATGERIVIRELPPGRTTSVFAAVVHSGRLYAVTMAMPQQIEAHLLAILERLFETFRFLK